MKKFYLITILLLAVLFNRATANHFVGAEMEYKISNDTAYFTLKAIENCGGLSMTVNPITLRSGSSIISVNITELSSIDITNTCPTTSSICSAGSFLPGFEQITYTGSQYLGGYSACEWEASWEQCCRLSTLSTGQADQPFYLDLTFNKCLVSSNIGPRFGAPETLLLCKDVDQKLNVSLINLEPKIDSFSYHLVGPMSGFGLQTPYTGSYSPVRPLHFLNYPNQSAPLPGGFRLNPETGEMAFRPVQVQTGTVVVEIKEWRKINGVFVKISSTKRDVPFSIRDCDPNSPTLIPNSTYYETCPGQTLCIDIPTFDTDASDSTKVSYFGNLPGAVFTHNNNTAVKATGTLCWTPTSNDVSDLNYHFVVKSTDNNCPFVSTTSRSFFVRVLPVQPEATRTITSLGCGVYSFSMTPGNTNYPYAYDWLIDGSLLNGQNTQFHFPSTGQKVIRSRFKQGPCIKTYYDTIDVNITVVPGFAANPQLGDVPLTVNFTDQSNATSNTFSWDFADIRSGSNNSSTLENPTHTFNYPGTYIVTQSVGNSSQPGCVRTKKDTITVKMKVDFSADSLTSCQPGIVHFTNLSDPSAIIYNWDFGDPGSGTSNNSAVKDPMHIYSSPGTYTVRLFAADSLDEAPADTMEKVAYITVFQSPVVNFSVNKKLAHMPLTAKFTNTSSFADTYIWNFGDPASGINNNSSVANPTHVYSNAGTYVISLRTFHSTSPTCQQIKFDTIIVKGPFDADFSADSLIGCSPSLVNFTNLSTSNVANYYWNFGDIPSGQQNTSSLANPSHTYSTAGSYTIRLIIESADVPGVFDTIIKTNYVTVTPSVTSFFTSLIPSGFAPLTVSFNNLSSSDANSWHWDFGDPASVGNNNSTIKHPSHSYINAGSYQVKLTSWNTAYPKCVTVYSATVDIPNAFYADFTANKTSGCTPLTVQFTDNSTNMAATWTWDFGDVASGALNTSTNKNPVHNYQQAGYYTVKLTITKQGSPGTEANKVKTNYIYAGPTPNSNFSASNLTGPAPLTVTFNDQSSPAGNTWFWNFGDNNFSSLQNPIHIYNTPGTYAVTFVAGDSSANSHCRDTSFQANYVIVTPPLGISEKDMNGFEILPNPAKTHVNISMKNIGNYSLELIDVNGRKVRNAKIENSDKYILQREDLAAGIYFLSISNNEGFNQRVKISFE